MSLCMDRFICWTQHRFYKCGGQVTAIPSPPTPRKTVLICRGEFSNSGMYRGLGDGYFPFSRVATSLQTYVYISGSYLKTRSSFLLITCTLFYFKSKKIDIDQIIKPYFTKIINALRGCQEQVKWQVVVFFTWSVGEIWAVKTTSSRTLSRFQDQNCSKHVI